MGENFRNLLMVFLPHKSGAVCNACLLCGSLIQRALISVSDDGICKIRQPFFL